MTNSNDIKNGEIIALFDPSEHYSGIIANHLRSSGFEPFVYTDLKQFMQDAKKNALVCVVNGDLIDDDAVASAYRSINQCPTVRIVSVSQNGSFDRRLELARLGMDYSLFKPIDNHLLTTKVNNFYQQLYPGYRDVMLASLVSDESKIFPILNNMSCVHVVNSEIREIFYNLEHYDQVMTIVECDLNDEKGADLLKAISTTSIQSDAPLLLVSPDNRSELAFQVSTFATYPITFKVYADSMPAFVELLMDTAKMSSGFRLYDDADVITSSHHQQKIIDLIAFSQDFNIPLSICSFKIDGFYEILKDKGKEESRKLYNKMSHIIREQLKHTDYHIRVAMDRMVVFFLGILEEECRVKANQFREIFKLMPNEDEDGIYIATLSVGMLQISPDTDYDKTMELVAQAVMDASIKGGDQIVVY